MIMRDIKSLLADRGQMTLKDLAIHFDMKPSAIEPILQQLVKKGQVLVDSSCCEHTCPGCKSTCKEDSTVYEHNQAG